VCRPAGCKQQACEDRKQKEVFTWQTFQTMQTYKILFVFLMQKIKNLYVALFAVLHFEKMGLS